METKYLKINPADNVVVAISDLKAGETITVDGHVITLKEDVPAGHKVTLKDFAQGASKRNNKRNRKTFSYHKGKEI